MTVGFRFAHLSDWHATTLVGGGRGLLQPKRITGWASWRLRRRNWHSESILEAAFRDVHAQNVDRILVTGDLTHVSLESEFRTASEQLRRLGSPERVFLIPGNHDCYVPVPMERSWDYWSEYLSSAGSEDWPSDLASCLSTVPTTGGGATGRQARKAPRYEDYPTLRIVGDVALIGLCSAIPVPILRAGGALGEAQLARLERLLEVAAERGLARVLMIHHPVIATDESPRRALRDAAALRGLLGRLGADLVIHGHKHRRRVHSIAGPEGPIPVIGVPSSSEIGSRPDKRAQYHIYRLTPAKGGGRHRLDVEVRGYDAASESFRAEPDMIWDSAPR